MHRHDELLIVIVSAARILAYIAESVRLTVANIKWAAVHRSSILNIQARRLLRPDVVEEHQVMTVKEGL